MEISLPYRQESRLRLQAEYIKKIAGDFHFSKEVVQDRGMACISYQEWDAKGIYDASDIIPHLESKRILKIRPPQHKLCHMKNALPSKQVEAKRCIGFGEHTWRKTQADEKRVLSSSLLLPSENLELNTFLTEAPVVLSASSQMIGKRKSEISGRTSDQASGWDENLLKMLTKTTAQYIVGHQTSKGKAMDSLCQLYGLNCSTDLISEEHMTEEDFRTCKGREESEIQDDQGYKEERKIETPLPVYYQIPAYCLSPKEKQEPDSKFRTAPSLSVKHFELTPPLRHQDLMNPKAGKHVYATENIFERELYSGMGKIGYFEDVDKTNHISMENPNQYDQHLQEAYPNSYQEWSLIKGDAGTIRWNALPSPGEEEIERSQRSPTTKTPRDRAKETEKVQYPPLNERQVLRNIVTQWKTAWMLRASWQDATLEQLQRDLTSLHNGHKITALLTFASGAVGRPRDETDATDTDMLPLISNALRDEDALVRMASALCHYIIRAVSEEARKVMRSTLHHGNDADSWAAAQCLALDGDHTYLVVKRILTQLFEVANKETEKQAYYILIQLSESTTLVHAMLGDALNSCNWRDRIVACRALSRLHGHVSLDLRNKLNHLMWKDWNPAVRQAAADTLGRMGLRKEIHDQLRENLQRGNWRARVEALSLIGWLRLMTPQLLPGFLQCFSNDFVAVRREACLTAGVLRIKDEMVFNCLYQLIQSDPIWIIRAFAFKAAGEIGHVTARLKELLLRAVESEETGVCIEACHCLATLRMCDTEVQYVLQDRLIVEPRERVRREVVRTLVALNMELQGSQEMILKIKQQAKHAPLP
ncbi:hypothetical protein FKM82_016608 [Ascaphus truei]